MNDSTLLMDKYDAKYKCLPFVQNSTQDILVVVN